MFAAQTLIRSAQRFSNEKPAVAQAQDDGGGLAPDNARIDAVVAREPQIGGVAVVEYWRFISFALLEPRILIDECLRRSRNWQKTTDL